MSSAIPGIHHVTVICDDPQENIDFFSGVMGLRVVKQTVNFDMPDTYHLYYGDEQGTPGTILTYFSWPGVRRGRKGTGQIGSVAFAIPRDSIDFWRDYLKRHKLDVFEPKPRFEERVLTFNSPDGLTVELVTQAGVERFEGWKDGPIPVEYALRGFHSVTLLERSVERTADLLSGVMGFEQLESQGNRTRFSTGADGRAMLVDVLEWPDMPGGRIAVGSVHHVAWRTPSDEEELAWREKLEQAGYDVTPVRDREYFHSIYWNEPGGVLFEIATDPPGFTIDEPLAQLGTHLKLPPWLEESRSVLEKALPTLHIPTFK